MAPLGTGKPSIPSVARCTVFPLVGLDLGESGYLPIPLWPCIDSPKAVWSGSSVVSLGKRLPVKWGASVIGHQARRAPSHRTVSCLLENEIETVTQLSGPECV